MEKLNRIIPIVLAVLFAVASTVSKREGRVVPPSQDSWFNSAVLKNTRPVVVKFGAEWCRPCRSMNAALHSLESRFSSRARFIRINVDEKPELFAQYANGSGIPQIMIFRDGKSFLRIEDSGAKNSCNRGYPATCNSMNNRRIISSPAVDTNISSNRI